MKKKVQKKHAEVFSIYKHILFYGVMFVLTIAFIAVALVIFENYLGSSRLDNYLKYSSLDLGYKQYWESPKVKNWKIQADKEAGLFGIRGGKDVQIESDKYRILCIGDSFTYGFLLNRDEAFPHILESKLGIENYEVLNSGVPGWETTQEYSIYNSAFYKLKPDIVILQHYANDIENDYYWKIKKAALDNKYKNNFLYNKFLTFQFVSAAIDNIDNNYSTYLESLYTGKIFKKHTEILLEYKNSVEKNGTEFILLLIPSISYKKEILQADKAHIAMLNFCKKNNISFIDPSETLSSHNRKEITLSKYDIHFNKKGNQILADIVYNYLISYLKNERGGCGY